MEQALLLVGPDTMPTGPSIVSVGLDIMAVVPEDEAVMLKAKSMDPRVASTLVPTMIDPSVSTKQIKHGP